MKIKSPPSQPTPKALNYLNISSITVLLVSATPVRFYLCFFSHTRSHHSFYCPFFIEWSECSLSVDVLLIVETLNQVSSALEILPKLGLDKNSPIRVEDPSVYFLWQNHNSTFVLLQGMYHFSSHPTLTYNPNGNQRRKQDGSEMWSKTKP